ncbi:MAG: hypothetical protein WC332_03375 [Clostridia bacterium]|jgi:hypothetical protein
MIIKEAIDEKTFNDMVSLIVEHPYPEIDCRIDKYIEQLRNYHETDLGYKFFRSWVGYIDEVPVGYISGFRTLSPRSEIVVHDNYIRINYRSISNDKKLVKAIVDWSLETDTKRVSWTSNKSERLWKRFLKTMIKKDVKFKELYFVSCEVA